jgi:hypothetical protein
MRLGFPKDPWKYKVHQRGVERTVRRLGEIADAQMPTNRKIAAYE